MIDQNFLKEPRLGRSVLPAASLASCGPCSFVFLTFFLSFFPVLYFSSRFPHVVNFASSAPGSGPRPSSLSPHLPSLPPSLFFLNLFSTLFLLFCQITLNPGNGLSPFFTFSSLALPPSIPCQITSDQAPTSASSLGPSRLT